jgi:nitrogen-specific signal transduction histidine kinase/HD-like signal output (HDOD) protein
MISKESVYTRIRKTGNLPTLSGILLKLLEACDNDAAPLAEIASLVSKDPALSFRVLQLVNSSFSGHRSNFTGIEQAVASLGVNSIKNIAVTTSIHQVFEQKRFKAVKQFNINTFWWHSLMCATLARRIAKKIRFSNINEAYLSGLLHDIGRMVLISTFPKEHDAFLLETEDAQNELWAEEQLIGVTHCEAGYWLVQNWNLNSMMADAIRYHHVPLDQVREAFPLIKIVYVANLLRETGPNHESSAAAGELLLGLDSVDLRNIVEGATEEVLQIADSLDIRVRPPGFGGKGGRKGQTSGQGNTAEDAMFEDIPPLLFDGIPPLSDPRKPDTADEDSLAARIRSIALLSGFLENLVQAGDSEAILAVFEQSMSILFNIEEVLFFLPDKDQMLLKGRTSEANTLQQLSEGLVLPVQRSSSLIVKAFRNPVLTYLTAESHKGNLADAQVMSAFRSTTVLFVPILAARKPAGVILLGLPEALKSLSRSDLKLIQVIAGQVGLCLFMENMKTRKAEEIEAERMAAVSLTARKFAHEINNPLGIISNYLTTMRLKLSDENDIQEELAIVGEEIKRISSMVNQMDLFSQTAPASHVLTDVNEVIEEVIHLVRSPLLAAAGTIISFRPDAKLPKIMTSRDALKQILINLLKNASEAMADGGSVEVRTGVSSSRIGPGGEVLQPDCIEIMVRDTGPGLPESIMQNLYKPLLTTKNNGHSGLGLSIVLKTVKDLGGSISCSSRPYEGTSFFISLPLSERNFQ